jgi:hypothetical protein
MVNRKVIAGKFKRLGDAGVRDDGTELFGLWAQHRIAYEDGTLLVKKDQRRLSISEVCRKA